MTWISSERKLFESLNSAQAFGLPIIRNATGTVGHRLAAGVFGAGQLAVTSDLAFRQVERARALRMDPNGASAASDIAKFRNDACLELLTAEVNPAIGAVRERFGSEQTLGAARAFDFFEASSREALADLDLNLKRATIANRILSGTRATADADGISGLCDVLDLNCSRLIELRRRRQEHNGPIGAAIGAAVAATGFIILGICSALSGGRRCSDPVIVGIADIHIAIGVGILLLSLGGDESDEDDESPDQGPL